MSSITYGKFWAIIFQYCVYHTLLPFLNPNYECLACSQCPLRPLTLTHFPSFSPFCLTIQFTKSFFSCISSDIKQLVLFFSFFSTRISNCFSNKKFLHNLNIWSPWGLFLLFSYWFCLNVYCFIMLLHLKTFRNNLRIWMILLQRGSFFLSARSWKAPAIHDQDLSFLPELEYNDYLYSISLFADVSPTCNGMKPNFFLK